METIRIQKIFYMDYFYGVFFCLGHCKLEEENGKHLHNIASESEK